MQTWEASKVNKAYTDVGLIGKPMQVSSGKLEPHRADDQCDEKDGTCQDMQDNIDWSPRVEPNVAARFKCEY